VGEDNFQSPPPRCGAHTARSSVRSPPSAARFIMVRLTQRFSDDR